MRVWTHSPEEGEQKSLVQTSSSSQSLVGPWVQTPSTQEAGVHLSPSQSSSDSHSTGGLASASGASSVRRTAIASTDDAQSDVSAQARHRYAGVTQKRLRELLARILEAALPAVEDPLTDAERGALLPLEAALRTAHFPEEAGDVAPALIAGEMQKATLLIHTSKPPRPKPPKPEGGTP